MVLYQRASVSIRNSQSTSFDLLEYLCVVTISWG
jgi:hypothetical protein